MFLLNPRLFIFFLILSSSFNIYSQNKKPDVVFIIVDDLNDWVGVMGGHPQTITPNIDRLASKGMLFTNAHCNAPQCGPSRTSLLSGLYPKSTGRYFNSTKRPPFFKNQVMSGVTSKTIVKKPINFLQHFKNHKYRVVSGGKIAHGRVPKGDLDASIPLHRGPRNIPFTDDKKNLWGESGAHHLPDEKTGDYIIAHWAIDQWKKVTDKPLMMAVGFYRPHRPFNAPKAYFEKFPLDKVQFPLLPKEDDWNDMPKYAKALARSHAHKPFFGGKRSDHEQILHLGGEKEWRMMVQAYLACVNYVDTQIGHLLKALEKNPRGRETMIILTSDHGWHLGEKRHWAKGAIWKNTTNVPFIAVAPGLSKAGSVSRQPISHVDIFPSLCDLAGIDAPKYLEGRSIVPLLKNKEAKREDAVLSYGPENLALQTERFRYIQYEDGSEELYDHQEDPHEWKNLAKLEKYTAMKSGFKKRLEEYKSK